MTSWTAEPKTDPDEEYFRLRVDSEGYRRTSDTATLEAGFHVVVADSAADKRSLPEGVKKVLDRFEDPGFVDFGHPFTEYGMPIRCIPSQAVSHVVSALRDEGYSVERRENTGFWPASRATNGEVRIHDC